MADYDIGKAFSAIENELIASMIRNLERHKAEEIAEGMNWSQWQVEQLNALDEYKRRNAKKYGTKFSTINDRIEEMLTDSYTDGATKQERDILRSIKKGLTADNSAAPFDGNRTLTGEFFKTNDRKLDALIKATTGDMKRAETAVLRMTNDKYRKIIFNAQVYANTGAGTYEKAVDMATKDFLSAGINCIEYKNGRRVNIKSYAEMAIRTANKRAYLQGEGEMRKKWGIHTVILNKRSNACPKCLPYVGKVIVDDVWSGGTAAEAREKGYLLMSECIEKGLYHPNCKDSHSTYFGDILDEDDEDEEFEDSTEEKQEKAQDQPAQSLAKPEPITPKEQKQCEDLYNAEQYQQYAERQAEKWDRMSEFSLDKDNKRKYKSSLDEWKEKVKVWKDEVKRLKKKTEKVNTSKPKIKHIDKVLTTATGLQMIQSAPKNNLSDVVNQISKYSNNFKEEPQDTLEKSYESGIISSREKSVKQYSGKWQKASLSDTISRLLKNPTASPVNKSGKIIYSSPETTLTVVYDTQFDYFRIQDTAKRGELSYMDINGNPLSNNIILPNGKQAGRPKDERKRITHFKNTD